MFRNLIRFFFLHTLVIFSFVLAISLSSFSPNDLIFYSTVKDLWIANRLGLIGAWIASPFFLFYGYISWLWVLFFLVTGIHLILGIDPKKLVKRVIFIHYLSIISSVLLALCSGSTDYLLGGIIGVLIAENLEKVMPYSYWIPIFSVLLMMSFLQLWKFPKVFFHKVLDVLGSFFTRNPVISIISKGNIVEEEKLCKKIEDYGVFTDIGEQIIPEVDPERSLCIKHLDGVGPLYDRPERSIISLLYENCRDESQDHTAFVPSFLDEINEEFSPNNIPVYFSKKRLFNSSLNLNQNVEVDFLGPHLEDSQDNYDFLDQQSLKLYKEHREIHPPEYHSHSIPQCDTVEALDELDQSKIFSPDRLEKQEKALMSDMMRNRHPLCRLSFAEGFVTDANNNNSCFDQQVLSSAVGVVTDNLKNLEEVAEDALENYDQKISILSEYEVPIPVCSTVSSFHIPDNAEEYQQKEPSVQEVHLKEQDQVIPFSVEFEEIKLQCEEESVLLHKKITDPVPEIEISEGTDYDASLMIQDLQQEMLELQRTYDTDIPTFDSDSNVLHTSELFQEIKLETENVLVQREDKTNNPPPHTQCDFNLSSNIYKESFDVPKIMQDAHEEIAKSLVPQILDSNLNDETHNTIDSTLVSLISESNCETEMVILKDNYLSKTQDPQDDTRWMTLLDEEALQTQFVIASDVSEETQSYVFNDQKNKHVNPPKNSISCSNGSILLNEEVEYEMDLEHLHITDDVLKEVDLQDICDADISDFCEHPSGDMNADITEEVIPNKDFEQEEKDLLPKLMTQEHLIVPDPYPVDNDTSSTHVFFPKIEDLSPNTEKIDQSKEQDDIESTMKMIEDTYESFNINMQVVDYSRGPTITRFELAPPSGLKLRTIFNLQDDLALQAGTSNLRIISPVEGRSLIGIEVPNKIRRNFVLRQQIESLSFQNSTASLPLILGVDVAGKEIVSDLTTTPHLLIAGTTGSGKSVYVNALIMGLLYKLSARDLKFIMIDPKMVELELYSGIPHLLAPIITKPEEALTALDWSVQEMDRRYKILSDLSVRNLKEYQSLVGKNTEKISHYEHLPYIVIIVDEFANLMLRAPKDTEKHISRLASMSRAVGIHLVLATQRPSVDVVTGVIKANFPSRIALRVSSKIDSRTIIDKNGAEALLGGGDMLFMSPDYSDVTRIQAPYVSNEDITKVVRTLKKNRPPDYAIDFSKILARQEESNVGRTADDASNDPLFEEVLRYAVDNGDITASAIQRRFRVGYNRASRLIDTMKDQNIISAPPSAGKGCSINITKDQISNYLS